MATKPEVRLSEDEQKAVVFALQTQAGVYRRASRAAKNPQVARIHEEDAIRCDGIAAKIADGALF